MSRQRWGWPTLGGLQFWADVQYRCGWRIQQHVRAGDYRLLDAWSRQHRLGSFDDCRQRLDDWVPITPAAGAVVLLLPGIIRTRHSMAWLARRLRADGMTTYCVSYPSTRAAIEVHAANLRRLVGSLTEATMVHFVGHSMGGLVVRAYLAGEHDPRVGRVVMLGTPNQGAEKADAWRHRWVYRWLLGPAGQQLATTGWIATLPPTPPIPVGIIAGGRGGARGFSFSLPGDNDGTVTVASTHLPAMTDFRRVYSHHTILPHTPAIARLTTSFLQTGSFDEGSSRSSHPGR